MQPEPMTFLGLPMKFQGAVYTASKLLTPPLSPGPGWEPRAGREHALNQHTLNEWMSPLSRWRPCRAGVSIPADSPPRERPVVPGQETRTPKTSGRQAREGMAMPGPHQLVWVRRSLESSRGSPGLFGWRRLRRHVDSPGGRRKAPQWGPPHPPCRSSWLLPRLPRDPLPPCSSLLPEQSFPNSNMSPPKKIRSVS